MELSHYQASIPQPTGKAIVLPGVNGVIPRQHGFQTLAYPIESSQDSFGEMSAPRSSTSQTHSSRQALAVQFSGDKNYRKQRIQQLKKPFGCIGWMVQPLIWMYVRFIEPIFQWIGGLFKGSRLGDGKALEPKLYAVDNDFKAKSVQLTANRENFFNRMNTILGSSEAPHVALHVDSDAMFDGILSKLSERSDQPVVQMVDLNPGGGAQIANNDHHQNYFDQPSRAFLSKTAATITNLFNNNKGKPIIIGFKNPSYGDLRGLLSFSEQFKALQKDHPDLDKHLRMVIQIPSDFDLQVFVNTVGVRTAKGVENRVDISEAIRGKIDIARYQRVSNVQPIVIGGLTSQELSNYLLAKNEPFKQLIAHHQLDLSPENLSLFLNTLIGVYERGILEKDAIFEIDQLGSYLNTTRSNQKIDNKLKVIPNYHQAYLKEILAPRHGEFSQQNRLGGGNPLQEDILNTPYYILNPGIIGAGLDQVKGLDDVKKVLRTIFEIESTDATQQQKNQLIQTIRTHFNENRDVHSKTDGLIFHGPGGVGKTMIAGAAAKDSNRTVIVANAGMFAQMYVGAGPRLVDKLKETIQKIPGDIIVFIDEADSLDPKNININGQSMGSGSREDTKTLNSFKALIDGVGSFNKKVTFILSTNKPEIFQSVPEFRTRFPYVVEFKYPNGETRWEIFKQEARRQNLIVPDALKNFFIGATENLSQGKNNHGDKIKIGGRDIWGFSFKIANEVLAKLSTEDQDKLQLISNPNSSEFKEWRTITEADIQKVVDEWQAAFKSSQSGELGYKSSVQANPTDTTILEKSPLYQAFKAQYPTLIPTEPEKQIELFNHLDRRQKALKAYTLDRNILGAIETDVLTLENQVETQLLQKITGSSESNLPKLRTAANKKLESMKKKTSTTQSAGDAIQELKVKIQTRMAELQTENEARPLSDRAKPDQQGPFRIPGFWTQASALELETLEETDPNSLKSMVKELKTLEAQQQAHQTAENDVKHNQSIDEKLELIKNRAKVTNDDRLNFDSYDLQPYFKVLKSLVAA